MTFICFRNFISLSISRVDISFAKNMYLLLLHIFSRLKLNLAFFRHSFLKCIWPSDSFALFSFTLVPRIGTVFFHSNDYVFIVGNLGAAITFFNSVIFAWFNCQSIQFHFIEKDLFVWFIFNNINLKDKSCKIYFSETLALLECKLCQLSNVISKFWTFQVSSSS